MASPLSMTETLKDLVSRFEDLKIEYMVTGSFAMGVYVPSRTTYDIDVVLEIREDQAESFERRFSPDFYVDSLSVRRAIGNESMFNIVSNVNGVKVDCIIRKGDAFERVKFQRREKADIEGIDFWVSSKEDLMLSKLQWARNTLSEMQLRDIARLAETGYDQPYLGDWIGRLDLGAVWDKVEEWKTQAEK